MNLLSIALIWQLRESAKGIGRIEISCVSNPILVYVPKTIQNNAEGVPASPVLTRTLRPLFWPYAPSFLVSSTLGLSSLASGPWVRAFLVLADRCPNSEFQALWVFPLQKTCSVCKLFHCSSALIQSSAVKGRHLLCLRVVPVSFTSFSLSTGVPITLTGWSSGQKQFQFFFRLF